MVAQVFSSSDVMLDFFDKIQELGFLRMSEKYHSKNFGRLGLFKFLKQVNQETKAFIFTNDLNFSVIILTGKNKNQNIVFLIVVSEDKKEVLFVERFACKDFFKITLGIYKTLFGILKIIDVLWVCQYKRCNEAPKLAKSKNGKFYWYCPGNNIHKKNQYEN
jgi:hypothetical protein